MTARKKTHRKTRSSAVRKRRQARKRTNALSFEALESRQLLAAITVSNASDILSPTADTSSIAALVANDGGDGISLREAVAAADNTVGEDTVTFDASVFSGGDNSLIRLTQGELSINESLSIDGSSVGGVVITGDANDDDITVPGTSITDVSSSNSSGVDNRLADNSQVLFFGGDNLLLTGLTITGGRDSDGGGISTFYGDISLIDSTVSGNHSSYNGGAGIGTNSGDVSLTNTTVSGNSVYGNYFYADYASGGGIRTNSGNISLTNSTVTDNTSTANGGGIFSYSGVVSLTDSTVSSNRIARNYSSSSFSSGGGIRTDTGDVLLLNSTVSDNSAVGQGGGISTRSGDISLTSSTLSGNSVQGSYAFGGGIASSSGDLSLTNSTVTGNRALGKFGGGGIAFNGDELMLHNSIVAGNTDNGRAPDITDVDDVVVENSLIGDTTGSGITATTGIGNILNQPALLGPLADNGGSTLTHALLLGSPAIDAGSNALAVDESGNSLTTDQLGEARFVDGNGDSTATVDIGAVESEFVLLGDANLDGAVDFLDISPFIALLSSSTFLNEADTNRDGFVNFLDISPFIGLLASGGGSSATSKSIVVASPVSSVVSVDATSETESIVSVASAVEVPVVTETLDAKSVDADPATVSQSIAATTSLPQMSLVSVSDSSATSVSETSEPPTVDTTVAEAAPVDTYIGPVAIAKTKYSILAARNSSLNGSENNGSLVTRRSLTGSAEQIDLPSEHHRSANVSIEKSFSTASELFDAHPESLDEVFDFELEETLAGLI